MPLWTLLMQIIIGEEATSKVSSSLITFSRIPNSFPTTSNHAPFQSLPLLKWQNGYPSQLFLYAFISRSLDSLLISTSILL